MNEGADTPQFASADGAVAGLYGASVSIDRRIRLSGGCINSAFRLFLSNGKSVFLKERSNDEPGIFRKEARGLQTLTVPDGPRIPGVIACGEGADGQFLLLEFIDSAPRVPSFGRDLGTRLAVVHARQRAPRAGFPEDNHIGATPQENGWMDTWSGFFGERRLRSQIVRAFNAGRADRSMLHAAEALIERLPDLLPEPDGGFHLLHGDLWGGNCISSAEGSPVLIDPAVSYGHREADIAMTELFGGFGRDFYSAYRDAWPMDPGYPERRDIYNLYHLLNHLNLFGASYLPGCRAILGRFRR